MWTQNVNIGVTVLEPTSTFVPFVSPDANFIVSDEPGSLDDFSIPDFNFRIESDDDVDLSTLIIRGEFCELNKKMDQILKHTNTFSITNWENMVLIHQATIEMLVNSNASVFEAQKTSATDSTKKIVESNEKIEKVVSEVKKISSNMQKFMIDFQNSFDKNVSEVNKVIGGFCLSLQTEKEALSSLCFGLQRDNTDHHTSIANAE